MSGRARARGRRWLVVTGSPGPHNLVSPAMPMRIISRVKADLNLRVWQRDKDAIKEMQAKAEDNSDLILLLAGKPLADFECEHGKLPNDSNISCQCWGLPTEQMSEDLRGRIREVRTASGHVRAALSKLV